ncbi:MAG: DUF1289 domain-containing protein [Proteobacteria bacterium]|nr:DUF1289 domain-containing protein [Pseudomonadota bacterium]
MSTPAVVYFDPETGPAPVPSPCVQVCRLDATTGWCEGCQRRLEEIGGWRALDEAGKREIWRRVLQRRAVARCSRPPPPTP